jgi:3-methyladenine DNA glycosylase AlkD
VAGVDVRAEHEALAAQLRALGRPYKGGVQNDSYTGGGHPFFNVSAPDLRRLARAWLAAHRKASDEDVLALADALFRGEAYEEKVLGAVLLAYRARARRLATPAMAEGWLDGLTGWAEIDSLCASVFGAAELAAEWPAWSALIGRLSRDPNINKRRASLVLLTRPARTSTDRRFADLAFEVIDRLKGERPILITKAVSWLLRSLTEHHREAVAALLDARAATLPAVAVRETRTKLATGTKSGRPAAMRRRAQPRDVGA